MRIIQLHAAWIALVVSGCFGSHDALDPPLEDTDAGSADEADAGTPPREAPAMPPDMNASPSPFPGRGCVEYLEGWRPEACTPAHFGGCIDTIRGVPCCERAVFCSDGMVVDQVICDDICAQSCELIEEASDCEAFGCLWFCGMEGPGCAPLPGSRCATDADCAAGQQCRPFWVDPCPGVDPHESQPRFCV